MNHHAFGIEAEQEEGISVAQAWAERELGMTMHGNPDVVVLRFGLFSVADARRVAELAAGAAFAGTTKVVIIAAGRAYHEAQNALLKIFEEPPVGTHLFLVLPSMGGLLPTLRSRIVMLEAHSAEHRTDVSDLATEFLKGTKEKRSAIIKRLTSGKDDDKKRELRDQAIALLNGIEAVIYNEVSQTYVKKHAELLSDIATLRTHLYDRSAPVKMILEHLAIVTPKDLV